MHQVPVDFLKYLNNVLVQGIFIPVTRRVKGYTRFVGKPDPGQLLGSAYADSDSNRAHLMQSDSNDNDT